MAVHMADGVRTIPHESDYQTLKKWQMGRDIAFWVLFVCSVIPPLTFGVLSDSHLLKAEGGISIIISEYLSIVLIPIFFILEIVCDRFYIAAEYTRRKGFIDNSFGSKLTGIDSVGYFSNDIQTPNFYKAAVNAFESCHFTYHISSEMLKRMRVKNGLFCIVFLCVAYLGADRNTFVAPTLQSLIAAYFLKTLINAYFFKSRVGEILEDFKVFFNGLIHKEFGAADVPVSLKLIMDYETNLAYGTFKSDSAIFQILNPSLSQAWDNMKTYYGIEKKELPQY